MKELNSPASDMNGKRHVVQHDWASIRDALHVSKNEHVSSVDVCVSFIGSDLCVVGVGPDRVEIEGG